MAKYPEVSHLAFDARGLVILAGDDYFFDIPQDEMEFIAALYCPPDHRIRIRDKRLLYQDELRGTVLEELLHSIRSEYFDYLGLYGIDLTKVGEMQGIQKLFEDLFDLTARYGEDGVLAIRAGITFTAQEKDTLARMMQAHAAFIEKYPNKTKTLPQNTLLISVMRHVIEVTEVYTNPNYQQKDEDTRNEELYVKLMKAHIRDAYMKNELADFFLSVLNIPEVPNLAQGLRHDHNLLLAKYRDTVLLPERIKGDLYAESVAKRLKEQGIPTGFNFGRGRG